MTGLPDLVHVRDIRGPEVVAAAVVVQVDEIARLTARRTA